MQSIKDVINTVGSPFKKAEKVECETCGSIYQLYETPQGKLGACKTCEDEKLKREMNIKTVEEYRAIRKRNFIKSFERTSSDLKSATVNNYKPRHETQQKAKQAAVDFVKNFEPGRSMLFSGNPGLGKSHLAYAITKALRDYGYDTLYIKSTDLLEHIRSTYNDEANINESQIFDMINDLDLLTIDDIGGEYVKANESGAESWASDVLYKVFDSRLDKAIIATTNYSETELTKKYGANGARIIDRMVDGAEGIRFEGESYRRQARF